MEPTSGIIRTSFGLKDEIKPQLEESYHSTLINEIKANAFTWKAGRLTIRLAQEFGFCYGVDRAIDYAYQTRAKFPDRRIFLTNEIIHNPRVNSKLLEMGVQFLTGPYAQKDFETHLITKEDVVILPAFGTTIKQLNELQSIGCILVDTTCGSVMSVWKRVESYAKDGFTSIIHGKYDHEETLATSSRAIRYPEGKFLIVRDKGEALKVCEYIESDHRTKTTDQRQETEGRENSKEEFLKEFANAVSVGFDPDRDLEKIGCANQTTMLSSESLEIANMLHDSIQKKYGKEGAWRFQHFDTICSATQERQDAELKLMEEGMNLMIVVGGYNSSNTGHLVEISSEHCPAYHVKDASCILSKQLIQHKKAFSPDLIETSDWLPEGNITIGVTAGASTPHRVIEEVIARVIRIADENFKH